MRLFFPPLLALPILFSVVEAKTLKIFVLTGQSNSLGTLGTTDSSMRSRVIGSHASEQADAIPFFWDNRSDGTTSGDLALGASVNWGPVTPQTGGVYAGNDDHWGPEIGFARMLWDAGYRDFGIIKASRGGGGNTFWMKGSADSHMYQHILSTVQHATVTLPAGYNDYEIAGLLYVQGESNSSTEAAGAGTRFSDLIANLKADLPNASSLRGVLGEIAGSGTARDTTRTNQKSLADSRTDIGYAESNGLTIQNQDGLSLHYDADSQILLGERMAAEMISTGALGEAPLVAWPELYAWFLGDHGATFDSNSAINRWANLKDGTAANDLTRRVSGQVFRRAVTTSNGANREVLRFDGSSDIWASSNEFGPLSGARTVSVFCRVTSTNNGFLFDGSTGTGKTRALIKTNSWQAGASLASSAWDASEPVTTARTTQTWQHHVFVYEPFDAGSGNTDTRVRHYIDGTLATTVVDADTSTLTGLIIGSNGGSPFSRLACEIAEIAVWQKALTASEIDRLQQSSETRWGAISGPPLTADVTQSIGTIPRFGRHPLQRIAINVPTSGIHSLQSLKFTLADGTRQSISAVHIVSTSSNATFDANKAPAITYTASANDTYEVPLDIPLVEGTNYLWVAVEPRRYAPLGTTLDARIDQITVTAGGDLLTSPADPTGAVTLGLVPLFNDVVRSGMDGIHTFRIPGIVSDSHGAMHAVYDHRYDNAADLPANVDVGYARSTDGGATWSHTKVIMDFDASVAGSSGNGVGDPCILHDPVTDTLWVAALWSFGNRGYNGSGAGVLPTETGQYVLTKSTDGGITWSAPINITAAVKDNTNWRLIFQGPGHGFAMRNGTLVFPSQYRDSTGTVRVCSVFSTDHGATWDFGSGVPTSSPQTNENTACELDDGRILFSMRTPSGSNGQRAWIHYTPGGAIPMRNGTWSSLYRLASVPDPVCQGSVIQWTSTHRGHPKELVLFGNPNSSSSRTNFTLRVSPDGGASWPVSRQLYAGSSAYSSICILPDRSIGVLFEKEDYTKITFARVEEAWLLNPSVDTDKDGIPDSWEALYGTNPAVSDATNDPDQDGQNNLQEYLAGTNPLTKSSLLRANVEATTENGFTISWNSVPGRTYQLESSTDMISWDSAPSLDAIEAQTNYTTISVPFDPIPTRFFRVRVAP